MNNYLADVCQGKVMNLTLNCEEKDFRNLLGTPFTEKGTTADLEKIHDYYVVEPQFILRDSEKWKCNSLSIGTNLFKNPPPSDRVLDLIKNLREYYSLPEKFYYLKWKDVKDFLKLNNISYVEKIDVPREQVTYIYIFEDKLIYVTVVFKNNFYTGRNPFKKIPSSRKNWIVDGFYVRDVDPKLIQKFGLKENR